MMKFHHCMLRSRHNSSFVDLLQRDLFFLAVAASAQ